MGRLPRGKLLSPLARETYKARIARLISQGFSFDQARGHPKATELTVRLERLIATQEGQFVNPELVIAKRSKNASLISVAKSAYASNKYKRDRTLPLFQNLITATRQVEHGSNVDTQADYTGSGVKGVVPGSFIHVEDEFLVVIKRRAGYYVIMLPQGEELFGPDTQAKCLRFASNYALYLQGLRDNPQDDE